MPNLELRNATQLHQKATATYDEAVKERDRLENSVEKTHLINPNPHQVSLQHPAHHL